MMDKPTSSAMRSNEQQAISKYGKTHPAYARQWQNILHMQDM
jgi:hypothetical protein